MKLAIFLAILLAGCLSLIAAAGCSKAGLRADGDAGTGAGDVARNNDGTVIEAAAPSADANSPGSGVDSGAATSCGSVASAGVYVLDDQGTLLRFDPGTVSFTRLGALNCPNVNAGEYNSMAVDRNGFAWINAFSGGKSQLFKLDIRTVACTATAFDGGELQTFGMGFSSNQPGSPDETLFIDSQVHGTDGNKFGSIGFPSLGFTNLGRTDGSLEFTGTGDAQLWGFHPDQPAVIGQIDKTSGVFIKTYSAPPITARGGQVAFAFAFWADMFWIFLKDGNVPSSSVYSVARSTGELTRALADAQLVIVGAGVSTCAPFIIP
ncbi:MAG TPA: hypothetical protein VNO55_28575 [Polyangia bacterium]|nr:hypothetical protein [Polyangia bacterium]